MELTMTNNFGFCELNENEMMMVDGGAITTAGCRKVVSTTIGIVAGVAVRQGVKKLGVVLGFTFGPVGAAAGLLVGTIVADSIGNMVANAIIG